MIFQNKMSSYNCFCVLTFNANLSQVICTEYIFGDLFQFILFHHFHCVYAIFKCKHVCGTTLLWRLEDKFQESALLPLQALSLELWSSGLHKHFPSLRQLAGLWVNLNSTIRCQLHKIKLSYFSVHKFQMFKNSFKVSKTCQARRHMPEIPALRK